MSTTTQPDWTQPQKVSQLDMAFGGSMERLLPSYESIPKDFRNMNAQTKWHKAQSRWFYEGIKGTDFTSKQGVDPTLALNHLSTIQGSFEPKHEHKVAAVAWLMSLWFDDVKDS